MSKASRNTLRTQTAWRAGAHPYPIPFPIPIARNPHPHRGGRGTALTINGLFLVAHRYEGPIARVLPTKTASLAVAAVGGRRRAPMAAHPHGGGCAAAFARGPNVRASSAGGLTASPYLMTRRHLVNLVVLVRWTVPMVGCMRSASSMAGRWSSGDMTLGFGYACAYKMTSEACGRAVKCNCGEARFPPKTPF